MTAKWPKIWGILSFWPKKLNGVWALDTSKFSAGLMPRTVKTFAVAESKINQLKIGELCARKGEYQS